MKKITILLMLFSFTISFAQFSEDFNGTNAAFPPAGWAVYNGANGLGTVEQWVQAGTDPEFRAQSGFEVVTAGMVAEDFIVSPLIPINATQNLLRFLATDFNQGDFGSILSIQVSTTSQTDPNSFTEIETFNEAQLGNPAPNSAVFSQFEVNLGAYVGQSVYIAFVHRQNDGDFITFDNVEVVQGATAVPNDITRPTPADMASGVAISTADANADNVPDNSVNFAWQVSALGQAADQIEFFLGDSPTTLQSLGTLAGTATTVTLPRFFEGTTYYWQVVPGNSAGPSTTQPVWSFTTMTGTTIAPGTVSNPTPADTATVPLETTDVDMDGSPDNAITFMWTEPSGDPVEIYTFSLGTSPTDLSLFTTGIVGPASSFRLSGVPDNTTFYWKLDAENLGGENTSSPVWEFTTGITASVNDEEINFMTLSPNPATDYINLNTELAIDDIVLTNALGQSISNNLKLENNRLNVSSLKNGLYFLSATSELGTQTIRFIKQ